MAGKRKTVYNSNLTNDAEWKEVYRGNQKLTRDFINYCISMDRSPATLNQYEQQLKVFFVWNLRENYNVSFIQLKKRDFVSFFGYGRNELGWSSSRLASFRYVLSSLSNYIERILDDEYPNFKNLVKVLEPISVEPIREKTVLNADDIERIMKELSEKGEYQEACWMSLLFSSGRRKAEVAQMKVEYFTKNNLIFDGLMYRTPKIRTKGKGSRGKQVPRYIFAYTFDPYFEKWMEEREKLGIKCEYLFVVKRGGEYVPATIPTFNSWAKRISEKFDIDFYNHACRHAWCTNLKKRGYPQSVIQKLQNWATADMVSIYDDTTDEEELGDFFSKMSSEDKE